MAQDFYRGPRSDEPHDPLEFGGAMFGSETEPPESARDLRTTVRPSARHEVPARTAPDVGEVLAQKYRVEELIGRSADELVLLATHLDLAQRVLVRVLAPEASAEPDRVARFQRAARSALEAGGDHTERVLDFGRLGSGAPYRAAELPRGPALADLVLTRGGLPCVEAVDVVIAACEAVASTRAQRVERRALSMSNLFIERRADGTPLVRIIDLGSSNGAESDLLVGRELAIPGADLTSSTLPYTAPEQLRNPATVDERADIWALGAILFELLAGRPPFVAGNPIALLAMITGDTPESLSAWRPDVPAELEQIVLCCLAKDPTLRPPNAFELAQALLPFGSPEISDIAHRVERFSLRSSRASSLGPSLSAPRSPSAVPAWRPNSSINLPARQTTTAPQVASRPAPANPERNPLRLLLLLVASSALGALTTLALRHSSADEPARAPATVPASEPRTAGLEGSEPKPTISVVSAPPAVPQIAAPRPNALPQVNAAAQSNASPQVNAAPRPSAGPKTAVARTTEVHSEPAVKALVEPKAEPPSPASDSAQSSNEPARASAAKRAALFGDVE
jgi:serine/threonine-protein kinase